MKNTIVSRVDNEIEKYKRDNNGNSPMYMLVSREEIEPLMEEVRRIHDLSDDIVITEHQGTKIVRNDTLKPGEIRLTDELPETSS